MPAKKVNLKIIDMKKNTNWIKYNLFLLFGFCLFLAFTNSSCSKKTGCPMNEQVELDLDDKKHQRNRPKSGLFPRR
jgi:hypothetical protein